MPVEALNEQWSIYLTQPWKTSVEAYDMEQRVLKRMESKHSGLERLQCTETELTSAWTAAFLADP